MNPKLKILLQRNFLSFAHKAILELEDTKIGDQHYLSYLARELNLFSEQKTRRLIINLPPGHLKTLLCSVCLTAWLLARNPSLKIMIISHAEHLSKAIARNIRAVMQSSWYKEIFVTRISKGHAAVTDFGTKQGGGVFAGSFGGRITGRRAKVIIVDDPHDISDSADEVEKAIEFFNTVLLSRLNNRRTDRVLVVAHRVHEHDLSASLLAKKKSRHVVLPMVATRNQTYQTTSGDWRRRKGNVLRPDAFGPEDLEELRTNSFRPDFEMLYQQNYDAQSLPAISADCFLTISEAMAPSAPIVLSVDPGIGKGQKSAFSVIQAWCIGKERYYLVDQFREQCDYNELRDKLRRFKRRHRPVAILIERTANGAALLSDLAKKWANLLIAVNPDGRSKAARLRAHAKTILGRRIYLPADVPWRDDFVSEFVEFPHGDFSDQVDATTQFLDAADKFANLTQGPQPILAVGTMSSGGRRVTIASSNGGERGLIAGVHSNGRLIGRRS